MKKVEIKKSSNTSSSKKSQPAAGNKGWSATQRPRLPHQIGMPLGGSSCCDGISPPETL